MYGLSFYKFSISVCPLPYNTIFHQLHSHRRTTLDAYRILRRHLVFPEPAPIPAIFLNVNEGNIISYIISQSRMYLFLWLHSCDMDFLITNNHCRLSYYSYLSIQSYKYTLHISIAYGFEVRKWKVPTGLSILKQYVQLHDC